jgi:putative (di)nucleoside polyphosphate hydrolase
MARQKVDPAALPYRPCVGLMVLNREGQVFVGKRVDQTIESWQMPQGGIDPGEEPRQTALRELSEEIGTTKVEFIREHPDWLTYDLPSHLVGIAWQGRYRGQKLKWFAVRFVGTDSDINLKTEHQEFSDWKWADIDDLLRLIVPFKRETYAQVIAAFSDLAKPAQLNRR